MACRAGITTDLVERKKYWESQYKTLDNWTEYGPYDTKQKAQDMEDYLVKTYGCDGHPGGADASGPWYAYKFDY